MSAEAKRVKILTLIELALGLALVVFGVVLLISHVATSAPFILCGEGLLTLFFGARGALIANVPARIGKLATLALIIFVVQLACAVGVIMMVGPENVSNEVGPVACACAPALVTLIIAILSRGIAKRAER